MILVSQLAHGKDEFLLRLSRGFKGGGMWMGNKAHGIANVPWPMARAFFGECEWL